MKGIKEVHFPVILVIESIFHVIFGCIRNDHPLRMQLLSDFREGNRSSVRIHFSNAMDLMSSATQKSEQGMYAYSISSLE